MRNLQEQVKKAFCNQKLFWPFTVWTNCSSDLKNFANSWPSVSNFKKISWSLEQFFLTVGQNNFGNKMPCFCWKNCFFSLWQKQSFLLRKQKFASGFFCTWHNVSSQFLNFVTCNSCFQNQNSKTWVKLLYSKEWPEILIDK